MYKELLCDICKEEQASYRCKSCGKNVCVNHINRDMWLCLECVDRYRERRVTLEKEVGNIFFYGIITIAIVVILAVGFIAILSNTKVIVTYISNILPMPNIPNYIYEIIISFLFFFVSIIFLGFFLKYVSGKTVM
ncbi:MAG TPA: hypothetical protein EYH44_00965 [Thermoprotei archaeon]|nr:hypothetical protein [Thermoprotei archaeon]